MTTRSTGYYIDVDTTDDFLDDLDKPGALYLRPDGTTVPLLTDEEIADLPNLAAKSGRPRLTIPPPPDR